MRFTRRQSLSASLLAAPLLLAACSGDEEDGGPPAANARARATDIPAAAGTGAIQLAPTPACGDADDPTLAQTEGPYFTSNSPERVSLIEAGTRGTRLVIEGFVLSTSCQPIARALVDFWQCDDAGVYDNTGYTLRGHQFTGANGRYRLETIVPALYAGRTRHIHVKVQAPGKPVLTTQLYFPGEAANLRDGIYNAALVLEDYRDASGGKAGSFDFVLRA